MLHTVIYITYVQSNHYKMCNVHCVSTGKSQNRQGMIKYKACHIVNTRAVTFIIIVQFNVFKASIIYPMQRVVVEELPFWDCSS